MISSPSLEHQYETTRMPLWHELRLWLVLFPNFPLISPSLHIFFIAPHMHVLRKLLLTCQAIQLADNLRRVLASIILHVLGICRVIAICTNSSSCHSSRHYLVSHSFSFHWESGHCNPFSNQWSVLLTTLYAAAFFGTNFNESDYSSWTLTNCQHLLWSSSSFYPNIAWGTYTADSLCQTLHYCHLFLTWYHLWASLECLSEF